MKENILAVRRLSSSVLSRCFSTPLGVFLVMKTLEDEQYVAIKAHKFTILERFLDIVGVHAILHIESTDSVIRAK